MKSIAIELVRPTEGLLAPMNDASWLAYMSRVQDQAWGLWPGCHILVKEAPPGTLRGRVSTEGFTDETHELIVGMVNEIKNGVWLNGAFWRD